MTIAEILAILNKHFKVDQYGRVYMGALEHAQADYGEQGVKTQLLYILCNAKAQGPAGKIAKKKLLAWANGRVK